MPLPTAPPVKDALAVPVTVYVSPATKPLYAALPVKVADVVPSYTLLSAVTPVIVKAFVVTALPLEAVTILTDEAPVLDNTIFWLLYEPVTDASAFKRIYNVPLALPDDCANCTVS